MVNCTLLDIIILLSGLLAATVCVFCIMNNNIRMRGYTISISGLLAVGSFFSITPYTSLSTGMILLAMLMSFHRTYLNFLWDEDAGV